jgi:hypothetical protein
MTDVDTDTTNEIRINWTHSIETMIARWGDEAKCFEWMHIEAHSHYDKHSRAMMIASNVLTAISGLSNVIAGGYSINGFQLSWVFGSLAITVSITNMLQEKLGYTAKATQHYQYSIQWGSIRRKIEEELSIPPESRKDCKSFLKYLRQDINQVSIAGNSMIPEFIRDKCYSKFNKIPHFDIPDICGKMEHTRIYMKSEQSGKRKSTIYNLDETDMSVPNEVIEKTNTCDLDTESVHIERVCSL